MPAPPSPPACFSPRPRHRSAQPLVSPQPDHADDELRIRLGSSHDLADYQRRAEARGEALECAILIVAPPGIVLAAAAPLRLDESELEVAGRIAGKPLAMRRCRTVALDIPAETEIVIEGRILPHLRRPEGPFGEFMGTYVPVGENHVFEVTAVLVQPGATFHALICGPIVAR